MNLLNEVKEQAIDYLKDNQNIETYGCDLHNEIFNTSYFCNSEKDAKNYLESYDIFEAIKEVRKKLNKYKSLIGFCGGPWTEACYMINGKGDLKF